MQASLTSFRERSPTVAEIWASTGDDRHAGHLPLLVGRHRRDGPGLRPLRTPRACGRIHGSPRMHGVRLPSALSANGSCWRTSPWVPYSSAVGRIHRHQLVGGGTMLFAPAQDHAAGGPAKHPYRTRPATRTDCSRNTSSARPLDEGPRTCWQVASTCSSSRPTPEPWCRCCAAWQVAITMRARALVPLVVAARVAADVLDPLAAQAAAEGIQRAPGRPGNDGPHPAVRAGLAFASAWPAEIGAGRQGVRPRIRGAEPRHRHGRKPAIALPAHAQPRPAVLRHGGGPAAASGRRPLGNP